MKRLPVLILWLPLAVGVIAALGLVFVDELTISFAATAFVSAFTCIVAGVMLIGNVGGSADHFESLREEAPFYSRARSARSTGRNLLLIALGLVALGVIDIALPG